MKCRKRGDEFVLHRMQRQWDSEMRGVLNLWWGGGVRRYLDHDGMGGRGTGGGGGSIRRYLDELGIRRHLDGGMCMCVGGEGDGNETLS